MIFAFITETPCIVFGNYNYKVKGVFEKWIRNNCNYIFFVNNMVEYSNSLNAIVNLKRKKKKSNFDSSLDDIFNKELK